MIRTIAIIVGILAGIATILGFIFEILKNQHEPVTSIQISITEPQIEIQCPEATDWCHFIVKGKSIGVISNPNLMIYVGVYSLKPFCGGWFFQKTPGSISKDGTWVASAQLGAEGYPAKTGDTFQIIAIVTDEETGEHLPDRVDTPQDIGNLRTQSDIVDLRVVRAEERLSTPPASPQDTIAVTQKGHFEINKDPWCVFPKEINDGECSQIYIHFDITEAQAANGLKLLLDYIYATSNFELRVKVGPNEKDLREVGRSTFLAGRDWRSSGDWATIDIHKQYTKELRRGTILLLESATRGFAGERLEWDCLALYDAKDTLIFGIGRIDGSSNEFGS